MRHTRAAKDFEARQRRLEAQEKSRDPSVKAPPEEDRGMSDDEFRRAAKVTTPVEKDENSAERLKRFLTGQVPLVDADLSNWLDGLAEAISKKGGDYRDKAARKDARRIIADLVKGAKGAAEESPIEQNWDAYVELIDKAHEMRGVNATPEALAALDSYSAEHTLRLLEREAPEPAKEGQ